MAGPNSRDVRLGVAIETTGEESLAELGRDLRDVGKAATEAAPDLGKLLAEQEKLTAATKARRESEAAARAEERAAREAAAQRREELARLRAETDRTTRQTEAWQARERALRVAVVDANAALRERRAAAQAAAAESQAAAAAESRHEATIRRTAEAARASAAQQIAAGATVRGELDKIGAALRSVQALAAAGIGGTVAGGLVRDVAQTADAYANLAARIRIATGEGDAFEQTFAGVFEIARRTGVAVDDVGALFVKLAQAGRELKLSNADALALTESITQALQLSGASAQEAASGVQQFAQALASGRLQGDELRSILENAPRLARALSEGLGVTVGQLRELGSQGQLTAARVIAALQGQSAALQAEFASLPPTVGRALANLSTAWTEYIGQTDAATGASATAAAAINALAANLDTLGTLLYSAGKAAAAWQALKLAQTMLGVATATRAATVETVALTAAQTAAATAGAGAAASAGRFAALLGGLKVAALLTIVTNLREIGTAIGETVARWAGWADVIEENERKLREEEQAARAMAQTAAALAQETARAAEAAAGLTAESRRLVGEFEQARAKGDSVAESLGRVSKALDLSDVSGIQTAVTALDVLAQRGAITGEQLRTALADALKGTDLGVFATTARAAFDQTEQGARRLAEALDAVLAESLRRAGTSARELQTGFSEAAASALNDVDSLAQSLDALGADAGTAGRLLADALDRATDAAGTERAVQAVIERIEELGRAGKLTGETLAAALEGARRKLDELAPGVSSLSEALRVFGLKSRAELQATADTMGAAYRQIAQAIDVSLADKLRAFKAYSEAAIAANGGVESSELKLQRVILENQAAAAGLGETIEQAMKGAKVATDAATLAQERYNRAMQADPSRLVSGSGLAGIGASAPGASGGGASGGSAGSSGSDFPIEGYRNNETDIRGGATYPKPDAGEWTFIPDTRAAGGASPAAALRGEYPGSPDRRAINGVGYWVRTGAAPGGGQGGPFGGAAGAPVSRPLATTGANVAATPGAAADRVVRVELTLEGRTASMPTTEQGAADFVQLLDQARLLGGR